MTLIDAETMWQCETCFYHLNGGCNSSWCDAGEDYRPAFDKLKVIEAEPIIHAHWIKRPLNKHPETMMDWCSNCNNRALGKYKRCPECGAHMDEVVK